ncbi:MAG: HPr family phosphocarrier protein [Clostridiales bacterium]|jgi:phosphocarrier protein|nr:HPr family phosphocarrier protein [Clostridiales bacterium]
MYSKTTTIRNKTGLHMRPATEFVAVANQFRSQIQIGRAGTDDAGNAKSLVMLLKLALTQDTLAELRAEGPDEQEAVDTLVSMIDNGFDDIGSMPHNP